MVKGLRSLGELANHWYLEHVVIAKAERFMLQQTVDWRNPRDSLVLKHGTGPFTVMAVEQVPDKSWNSVGHPQWLQVSKNINGFEMIYDSYAGHWVLPANLSEFGKIHPTTFAGSHFRTADKTRTLISHKKR